MQATCLSVFAGILFKLFLFIADLLTGVMVYFSDTHMYINRIENSKKIHFINISECYVKCGIYKNKEFVALALFSQKKILGVIFLPNEEIRKKIFHFIKSKGIDIIFSDFQQQEKQ